MMDFRNTLPTSRRTCDRNRQVRAAHRRPASALGKPMLTAVLATALIAQPAGADPKLYDVEYAIISAAIRHGLGDTPRLTVIDGLTTGTVVDITDPARPEAEIVAELETSAVALREWSRLNRKRYTLQAQFDLPGEYVLLSPDERQKIFLDADPAVNWELFGARYPDSAGIIRASRPGIDDNAGTALLYLEFECGADCGSGRLIVLRRDDSGEWQVGAGVLLWITAPE